MMRELKHPNVVCTYGVAVLEQPLYIILEFVPGGALDSYLRKNKNIDRDERLLMSMGAAWGWNISINAPFCTEISLHEIASTTTTRL